MEDRQTAHDMIDVTDCLEARDAIRGMKNFCFWLMLLSLLILQGLFWLDQGGWVQRSPCCVPAASYESDCPAQAAAQKVDGEDGEAEELMADSQTADSAEEPAEDKQPAAVSGTIAQQAQEVTREVKAEAETEVSETEPEEASINWSKLKLPSRYVFLLICIFNFLLLFSAVLYCLTLLITLKISLVSRLGGISHISRAFFISLFLLVFLFPWQSIAPGILIGAIYLPKELLCFYPMKASASKFWIVLMFLRFAGLWLLVVWLLLWSWLRSGKWYRATQRRLGIVSG